jgi:hypothetical protein
MADTDTAGTVECEAQAGASDAAGCGIDASDDFEVFERAAALELDARDMATDGPGEAATGGGGRWQRGRARYRRIRVCYGWRSGRQRRRSRS